MTSQYFHYITIADQSAFLGYSALLQSALALCRLTSCLTGAPSRLPQDTLQTLSKHPFRRQQQPTLCALSTALFYLVLPVRLIITAMDGSLEIDMEIEGEREIEMKMLRASVSRRKSFAYVTTLTFWNHRNWQLASVGQSMVNLLLLLLLNCRSPLLKLWIGWIYRYIGCILIPSGLKVGLYCFIDFKSLSIY